MSGDNLTDKQKRFVEEYLVDLNATQAAIRAGYSEKTAKDIGCENLAKPNIQSAISEAMQARSERTETTQDMVLRELAKIGFSDLRNVFTAAGAIIDVQDWDDSTAGAISSLEVVRRNDGSKDEDGNHNVEYVHKIKVWDKVSALEKMGKHLGMFVNRVEHSGPDKGPIQTKDVGEGAAMLAELMGKYAESSGDSSNSNAE